MSNDTKRKTGRSGECPKQVLVDEPGRMIVRCGCDNFHIRTSNFSLRLNAADFYATARMFKMALGMAAGRDQMSLDQNEALCLRCGRRFAFEPDNDSARIAADHGFTMTTSILRVYGYCLDCFDSKYPV